jgi:hypothetical protein
VAGAADAMQLEQKRMTPTGPPCQASPPPVRLGVYRGGGGSCTVPTSSAATPISSQPWLLASPTGHSGRQGDDAHGRLRWVAGWGGRWGAVWKRGQVGGSGAGEGYSQQQRCAPCVLLSC